MTSHQRSLAWSSACRSLKADRMLVPAGLAAARTMAQTYSHTRQLRLSSNGRYDRSAIMRIAALAARHHQKRYGCSWQRAMSVALQATWQIAKTAKLNLH